MGHYDYYFHANPHMGVFKMICKCVSVKACGFKMMLMCPGEDANLFNTAPHFSNTLEEN